MWVLLFLAGLFIGWNLPQPGWAVAIQNWVVGVFQRMKEKISKG